MSEIRTYTVTGMSCDHCERAVRAELEALGGVTVLDVSALRGSLSLSVDGPAVTDESVTAAVDEAGYGAERAS